MITKDWYVKHKVSLRCSSCEEKDPVCLLYHHLDKDDKVSTIWELVENESITIEELQEEMSKCIVLCWNCHMKLHRDLRDREKFDFVDFCEHAWP